MNKYKIYLFVLIVTHFTLFFLTGLFRHWGFLTSINDLAHFDQAIWGTIHGSFLLNTDVFNMPTSRLAMHFDPIQLIFVPFYLIYPSVVWLIASQAFAISITAWPIFYLAKRILVSEASALMWAGIFLVNPFVLNAGAWDFHPITLAVPFIALGILAIELKKFKMLLLCSCLILMCKEHLGIMVFGFGLLWWIQNKDIKKGLLLGGVGLSSFYIVLNLIMPYFSPTGKHIMLSEGVGQLSRYSWLGESVEEIIKNFALKPFEIIKTVLIKMGGAPYLFALFFPFLGISALGWKLLLPGLSDLSSNLLSANPMQRSIIAYHSVSLIPVFTIAAIFGVKNLIRYTKKISINEITIIIVLISCILGYFFAPLPLPGSMNVWAPVSFINYPDQRIEKIRKIIGKDKSISVQANVGAHFSQRKEIYRFPQKINEVDSLILWLDTPTRNMFFKDENIKENRQFLTGTFDNHLQMDRVDFFNLLQTLIEDKEFSVVYWNDPWIVIKKGATEKHDVFAIKKKINQLRDELYLNDKAS